MKKLLETVSGTYFEVDLYYYVKQVGCGNWNIFCEVEFDRHKKAFRFHTTDSEMIDTITEMKASQASFQAIFDDIQEHMHSKVFEEIRFEIAEWLYIEFE